MGYKTHFKWHSTSNIDVISSLYIAVALVKNFAYNLAIMNLDNISEDEHCQANLILSV